MLTRFSGTVEPLLAVDVAALAAWASSIPLEVWPQQVREVPSELRPAMVNEPGWMGFGAACAPVAAQVLAHTGGRAAVHMLSVVMPGAGIPAHADRQLAAWCFRVHIPLFTNPRAWFIVDGENHHLQVGMAYKVNTEAVHEIVNAGTTPRLHYMFDVMGGG